MSQPPKHLVSNHMIASMAAIQAQIVVKIVFAPAPFFMEKLTRPALVLSLKSYGEDPPPSWTKVELCARLQELADRGEVQPPRRAKDKTPLEDAVTALNKAAAKKSVLQAHVADMGVKVSGNETIAILQTRAMQHLVATVEATGQDKMGFGKYANQSYNIVKMNDEQYCRWAITTAEEGSCSMYLTRFATWLKQQATSTTPTPKPKVDMNQFVKDKEKRAANKIEKTTTEGYPATKIEKTISEDSTPELKSAASSSSTATEEMLKQLMETVGNLAQEVQTLKLDRGEKPRKVMAKPDATMEPAKDWE